MILIRQLIKKSNKKKYKVKRKVGTSLLTNTKAGKLNSNVMSNVNV